MSRGKKWLPEWDEVLLECYADERNDVLVRRLGCSLRTLERHARRLGLRKSDEFNERKKEWAADGVRMYCEYMRITGQKIRRGGICGKPFEKGHKFSPDVEAKMVKAIQDRAQEERLRIIRKQKRSTGWKMVDYGTWQKPKKVLK